MVFDWPIYFKDRLIIKNLASNTGIATLWTPKEDIVKNLDPLSVCVIGQLYTKRGINYILRNVLANPAIRYLIVCGVDRQGSGEALLNFFKNGIGKEYRVIGDEKAQIDREIRRENLNLLRQEVEIFDFRGTVTKEMASFVKNLRSKNPFGEAEIFPEPEITLPERFPSDISGFKIRCPFVGEAWLEILKAIMKFGVKVPSLYGETKQVYNVFSVIEEEDIEDPRVFKYFNFGKDELDRYIKGFFEKDRGEEPYTYGERLFSLNGFDQVEMMLRKLKGWEFERGALATLWDPHKDNFPPDGLKRRSGRQTSGWQVPCLVLVQVQSVNGNLYMTAYFRNNDMYGAWPLNTFALRELQFGIAKKLGKRVGSLTTISQIAEIYDRDWDAAQRVLAENDKILCRWDPRGNFVIDIEGTEIVVQHQSPDGRFLKEYRVDGRMRKAARNMSNRIIRELAVSDLGACADLGRQLAKAETAVKLGLRFEQDQELEFKPQSGVDQKNKK